MNKEYDYGMGQIKIKTDDTMFRYTQPGKGESTIPLSNVSGIAYQSNALSATVVILGAGTKLVELRVPKRSKSKELTDQLTRDIEQLKKQ